MIPQTISSRLRLTSPFNTGSIEFKAPSENASRRFAMLAYSGGAAETEWGSVVIDLAGMEVGGQRKPILREHDRKQIVGHSDKIELSGNALMIEGKLSRTAAGKEVAELADDEFPWQASVGVDIKGNPELVKDGQTVTVNGLNFTGPGLIIRKSVLRESSFVPLGADSATSAAVFADGAKLIQLEQPMEETPVAPEAASDPIDAENTGFTEGYKKAKEELQAFAEAFPDDLPYAIAQFIAGGTVESAKAAKMETTTEELQQARAKILELEKRIATLPTSAAPVSVNLTSTEPLAAPTADDDPKKLAEWEWDNQKTTFASTSKERYTSIRVAELTGRLKVLTNTAPTK